MRVLKVMSVTVAMLFLGGAVLTAISERALAAEPLKDAGPSFFPASKAGPLQRPRPRDAGAPVFFPASKSAGGAELPGVQQLREKPVEQSPQQNGAP